MKNALMIAALLAAIGTSTANAKDVTLTFTDQEQNALGQLLDAAVKGSGLAMAGPAAYFQKKFTDAAVEPKSVPLPPEKPADKK